MTAENTSGILNLSDIITSSKTANMEFPGFDGFNVNLAFLSRDEMIKLRKKAVNTKINRRTRQPEEVLDEDVFLKEYIKAVVKGWTGLKFEFLVQLIPVDESNITDMNATLPFSAENAEALMKNSTEFDSWVTEMVGDLANFTKNK